MMLKQVYEKMEKTFKENVPNSLYMNYQELEHTFGSQASAWETLLDDPEMKRYVDSKLAKYIEIDARKALNKLANSEELKSTDVTALNRLIENSKLLQQKHSNKQNIVVTYIPPKEINHESQTM